MDKEVTKSRWSSSKSRSRSRSKSRSKSKSNYKPVPEFNSKPEINSKVSRKSSKTPPTSGPPGKENRDAALFTMLKSLSSNVEHLAAKVGKLETDKSSSRSSSRSRERSRGRSRTRSWQKSRSKRSRSSSRESPVSRKSRRSERSSSSDRKDKTNGHGRRQRSYSKNGRDSFKDVSRSRSRSRSRSTSRSHRRTSRRRGYSRSRSRSRTRSSSLEGRYRKRSYAEDRVVNKAQDPEPKERKYLLEHDGRASDGRTRTKDPNDSVPDFNEKATGTEIDSDLADVMTAGFTSYLPDAKLTKYTGELKLPQNCGSVTTPNLNRELFANHIKLGKFCPRNDARLANVQRLMLKSAVAILQSAELLNKQSTSTVNSTESVNGGNNNNDTRKCELVDDPKKLSLDLQRTAIELIGHAHQELSVRRRELLHTSVPEELSSMCFEKVDPGNKLFGDNIDVMMKTASKKYWTNSFKRGGFSVRRFQPFTRGRSSRTFQKRITYARDRGTFEGGPHC